MHGKSVLLDNVTVRFGDFTAIDNTRLEIKAGEFFSILGPSGCGKTTILRVISGFQSPTEGRVLIGGEDATAQSPNKRSTALIFQNLALFPLMPVWENVAFGLEARGVAKQKRRERAYELLDLVGLVGHEEKMPDMLSGGQRQRVAVARALAVEPSVLLLDEPLSALDLKLRQHMRAELKAIQRKTGVTFIFITHDQGEALTMSDRVAVMKDGLVEQVGTTDEIYSAPATPFVATFVGENNVFEGKVLSSDRDYVMIDTPLGNFRGRNVSGLANGDKAMLFVRPESLLRQNGATSDNSFEAHFQRRDLEGTYVNLFFNSAGGETIVHESNRGDRIEPNACNTLCFAADDAIVMPARELADE